MTRTFALILTLLVSGTTIRLTNPVNGSVPEGTLTKAELQLTLRDLWTGHVFWVRSVVLASHYDDAAGAGAAEAKVVENARAIADAVIPFYGREAADRLFGLLAGHYEAVKDYMEAGYAERERDAEAAAKTLAANAEEIAAFLAGANPYLPREDVLPLLLTHGGHHMQQIEAIHRRDFSGEAVIWEAMQGHIYGIADALAGALARQFPDQVTG